LRLREHMNSINVLIYEPYAFDKVAGNSRTLLYFIKFIDKLRFKLIFSSPFETNFTQKLRKFCVECVIAPPPERVKRYGGDCLKTTLLDKLLTILDIIRYNYSLVKIIRDKDIHIVYSGNIRSVLTVGLATKIARKPLLWYIKGELNNPILDTIGFILADRILFFCEQNRDDKYPMLVKFYNRKIRILRSGIDLQLIEEIQQKNKQLLKKELRIDNRYKNLVCLGQLYPLKGIHYLIDAVAKLIPEFPEIKLYVVGDHLIEEYQGYPEELLGLVEKYGLQKNVIFTGWRKDALDLLGLMDVLVHPSLSEGLPRAVLEGMALGKAVVASRVGGLRELIKNGENGFLVEPGNVHQLTEKIALLLENAEMRVKLGQAARQTVAAGYDIEGKVREFERILQEMTLG
jgi:glycosyltransferase involved in cell wall biosynthesis